MKELSLNILDVAKNSVKAGASLITIEVDEHDGWRVLTITDDGCGMSPEFLAQVTDPFTTTRTTRRVGMGLPLLKLAAEQADGKLEITSSQTPPSGTTVRASFRMDHLDCVPVGDFAGSAVTLIQGSPDIDFIFRYRTASGLIELETAQMRQILEGIPLDTPEVLAWVQASLSAPPEP